MFKNMDSVMSALNSFLKNKIKHMIVINNVSKQHMWLIQCANPAFDKHCYRLMQRSEMYKVSVFFNLSILSFFCTL